MLALGILPVLAFARARLTVELRGGLFQDFAPSAFHLQHVVLPILTEMGLHAEMDIKRPGYVPRGEGMLQLTVTPLPGPLHAIIREETGPVTRVWGIALSSHLEERKVASRMANTARDILAKAGHQAVIEIRNDAESLQRGAALALFADRGDTVRLDLADKETNEIPIIESYLPRQLSEDEIRQEVLSAITELNARSVKEVGKVMGVLSKKLAGKAQGSGISQIAKEELQKRESSG